VDGSKAASTEAVAAVYVTTSTRCLAGIRSAVTDAGSDSISDEGEHRDAMCHRDMENHCPAASDATRLGECHRARAESKLADLPAAPFLGFLLCWGHDAPLFRPDQKNRQFVRRRLDSADPSVLYALASSVAADCRPADTRQWRVT
jgi:hypothetical protein